MPKKASKRVPLNRKYTIKKRVRWSRESAVMDSDKHARDRPSHTNVLFARTL